VVAVSKETVGAKPDIKATVAFARRALKRARSQLS
jgi:hypothetical protein